MANGADRGRSWRCGHAHFSTRNFFQKRNSSRNHHELCGRRRCVCADNGKSVGPPLLLGQQSDRSRKWRPDFSRFARGDPFGDDHVRELPFKEGEVSDAFAEALAERARAGAACTSAGFGCDCLWWPRYEPGAPGWRAAGNLPLINVAMNFRTHRKLLVIDDGPVTSAGRGSVTTGRATGAPTAAGVIRIIVWKVQPSRRSSRLLRITGSKRAELLHGDEY